MIKKLHTIQLEYGVKVTDEQLWVLQKYEPEVGWKTLKDFEIPQYAREEAKYAGWNKEAFDDKALNDYELYLASSPRECQVPWGADGFKFTDLAKFTSEDIFVPFKVTAVHEIEVFGVEANEQKIRVSDVLQALQDIIRKAGN